MTVKKIHGQLIQDPNFPPMSYVTLWKIMKKQLKFKIRKFHNKPVPFERDDISAARHKYLRLIKQYRNSGYEVCLPSVSFGFLCTNLIFEAQIFYQDESWVNESQAPSKGWHVPEKEVLAPGNSRNQIDIWLSGVGQRFGESLLGNRF